MVLRRRETPLGVLEIDSQSSLPGDYTCCDLVVKIKECEETEDPTTQEPTAPEPAPPGRPETCHLSEECSEYQQMPTSSLTLQVGLSVHPSLIPRRGDLSTQPHACF